MAMVLILATFCHAGLPACQVKLAIPAALNFKSSAVAFKIGDLLVYLMLLTSFDARHLRRRRSASVALRMLLVPTAAL
jgi:hypothetical protein